MKYLQFSKDQEDVGRADLKENPQTPNAEAIRGAIEKLRRKTKKP